MARLYRNFDDKYVVLTKHLKRLIIDELGKGNYSNLQNPQTRSSGERVRFKIMTRPPGQTFEGARNMNLGHNEALLFLHCDITDKLDISFQVPDVKYRWAIGELVGSNNLIEGVNRDFSCVISQKRDFIRTDEYPDFVKSSMDILDRRISMMKIIQKIKSEKYPVLSI